MQKTPISLRTLCFTGHRPTSRGHVKLTGWNWHNPWDNDAIKRIAPALINHCQYLINLHNITTFISGGALGIDQIAFWAVQKLKVKYGYAQVKNILAIPCSDQSSVWKKDAITAWYDKSIAIADEVIYVDTLSGYSNGIPGKHTNVKLVLRNRYMVDRSDYVLAVWDGSVGGTKDCVTYAQRSGKNIYVLNPTSLQFSLLSDHYTQSKI